MVKHSFVVILIKSFPKRQGQNPRLASAPTITNSNRFYKEGWQTSKKNHSNLINEVKITVSHHPEHFIQNTFAVIGFTTRLSFSQGEN